ncbi:hypothetical protein ACTD5D_19220 [Nocardia takedensis]|uniref:hypothetical protein n=1 Tax=Nocardia takedensis TaxID=259390 RepID=UPI003F75E3C5
MPTDHTSATGPRRFLIAVAVAEHSYGTEWDRPGLVQARAMMIELFTTTFGYILVPNLGVNPTAAQLLHELDAFCTSSDRRPDDIIAIYFTGHGERLPHTDAHVLYTADTHPSRTRLATTTAAVAHHILYETPVRRVLLMLDTCFSGKGGADFTTAALDEYTHHWDERPGNGVAVITSTQPHQMADAGQFPRLFTDAVNCLSTAGHSPETIAVQALVTKMNSLASYTPWQAVGSSEVRLIGEAPPFLPNPRHDRRLYEVDLALQQAAAWEEHTQRRRVEFEDRMLLRARGDSDGTQWWFRGRHTVLTDITAWLHHPDPDRPLLAVTGDPGSGKTAVLGVIAAMAHPDYHRTVPIGTLGFPPEAIPTIGAVDVAIYAQNLTIDQIRDGIAAAAELTAATVGELLDKLTSRNRVLTILIDGLDEATDSHHLNRKLLRPLLDHGGGRIRLLVGTRPFLLAGLGTDRDREVDLDAHRYADPDAMSTYIMRGLIDSTPDSVYLGQNGEIVRAVADAVTDAAYPSFLVARIVATTLAATPTVPDPRDSEWRRGLPALPGEAMRRDLDTRLGADADKARDLLRPLAFAQGQGLPWEDVWAGLASALAGVAYTDADLIWLRRSAGSYVVESTENGRSAYRLYHQALAEHLTERTDPRLVHATFVHTLCQRVAPASAGGRLWVQAHPYTLRHLATHAAHAGLVDALVADLDYLTYAEPAGLLEAMQALTTEAALLNRAFYRCSAAYHRYLSPARRRQILAIDAARFDAKGPQNRLNWGLIWQVRWATGAQTHHAHRGTLTGHTDAVYAVACADTDRGPLAVTGGSDRTARVWNLRSGNPSAVLTGHTGAVTSVACTSIDGLPIAVTGSWDATVRVWDLTKGTQRAVLVGHTGAVYAAACSNVEGRPVAVTGGEDLTVRIWHLRSGAEHFVLSGHTAPVSAVACTDVEGRSVAVTGSWDGTLRVWDLAARTQRAVLAGHSGGVTALTCTSINGRSVAVTSAVDETVRIWDLATASLHAELTGHAVGVTMTSLETEDNHVVITGGVDRTVWVWDLATGTTLSALFGHTGTVGAVACTDVDGDPVVVTGSYDTTVRSWDLTTDAPRKEFTGHTSTIRTVACTDVEGDPVVVTGSYDTTVRLWDLTTGVPRYELKGHTGAVHAVACTAINGGPVAVTGGVDETVRVWDLGIGVQHSKLTGHIGAVHAIACLDVERRPTAVTGGDDMAARVWDLRTGVQVAVLTGHTAAIHAIACLTVDGHPIAITGGRDNTARVWDLITGKQQAIFDGHTDWVTSVAYTVLNGQPVAVTGSRDNTVRVWELAPANRRVSIRRIARPRHATKARPISVLSGRSGWVTAVDCTKIGNRPTAITAHRDRTVRAWDLTTMTATAVIDCPSRPQTITHSGTTIVIGFGNDLCAIAESSIIASDQTGV